MNVKQAVRRKKLSDAIQQEREKDMIYLRKEDLSNQDIAEAMGVSHSIVTALASQLIKQGRLEKRRRGRIVSDQDRNNREERIITCREQGLSTAETVKQTGLSQGVVAKTIRGLIAAGQLKKYPPRRSTFYHNPDHPRFKTIVKMVQARATLGEIGTVLKLTRERVRQLIAKIREEHGDEIFKPEEKILWTSKEAAAEVRTGIKTFYKLCQKSEIPFLHRGKTQRLLNAEGLAELKQHPLIIRKRVCDMCGRTFVFLKKGGGNRKSCYSNKCVKERKRRKYDLALLQQKPRPESLQGWRGEVLQCLKGHVIEDNEQWFSNTEAYRRAGISKMQLGWLHYCHILTVRPHPTKKNRMGNPIALYAASELDIVRRVYKKHRARGGK